MNATPTISRGQTAAAERWELADRAAAAQAASRVGISQLAGETGRSAATLRRWAWVARQFPPERRGYSGITFAHYEAAAASPGRFELLDRASRENWSVARVRMEVAAARAVAPRDPVAGVTRRGPHTLEEAAAYLGQLASLRSATTVADRVRERVHEVRELADALEEMWESNKRRRGA